VSDPDLISRYNYDEFIPNKFGQWLNFPTSPALGEPAPDYPLWDLDQQATSLRQVIALYHYTIVEFGSFT
jgi:hypothetical protein